jgi:hypothetical protein
MTEFAVGFALGIATLAGAYLFYEPLPRLIVFLKYSLVSRDEVARETKKLHERLDDMQAYVEGRFVDVEKKIEVLEYDEF